LKIFFFFYRLENLKEEDSGHYVCHGKNSVGHNRDYVCIGVRKAEEQEIGFQSVSVDDQAPDIQYKN
jgi:hypothetical protein